MAIFILVFFLLMVAYAFLINFYRRAWNGIAEYAVTEPVDIPVSVIVPVRNEERNIGRLIECLKSQDYPRHLFEVVVVNDRSEDNTTALIDTSFVRLIELPGDVCGKKNAIAEGIKQAKGELIITTDADCEMGTGWLKALVSFYRENNAQFIAAPVKMKAANSVLGIFQSLDFLTMQGITGASVHKQFHTLCNGANLAYPRKIFNEVNGFEGIGNIPSGDDMLLMHKIFAKNPARVFYLKNSEAVVTTPAEKSWRDFFNQRIRWASKAVHYKDKTVVYVLLLTYLVNVFFLVFLVAAFFQMKWAVFLGLFFVAKVLIEFPFVNAVSVFFGQQKLVKYFISLQPVHIVYIIISGWLGRFGSYTWKNRKIFNFKDGSTARK